MRKLDSRLKQDHIIKDKKLYLIDLELKGYGMIRLHLKIIKLLIASEYDVKSLFKLYAKEYLVYYLNNINFENILQFFSKNSYSDYVY